eukprot:472238-Pelagomonas_calceolata.AAC.7
MLDHSVTLDHSAACMEAMLDHSATLGHSAACMEAMLDHSVTLDHSAAYHGSQGIPYSFNSNELPEVELSEWDPIPKPAQQFTWGRTLRGRGGGWLSRSYSAVFTGH